MNNKQDCFELEEKAWSLSEFTNKFENVDYSESNVDDVEIII